MFSFLNPHNLHLYCRIIEEETQPKNVSVVIDCGSYCILHKTAPTVLRLNIFHYPIHNWKVEADNH